MDVLLANPRGFCAGVDRAIAIVEQALAQFGAPIYVRHEVVHNRFVVDDLQARRARSSSRSSPRSRPASTVVFSAHGVSKAVRAEADARGLTRVRRDVPARDQGARRGRQDARARPRDRDDRPPRPSGGRGHDGAVRRAASTSSSRSLTSRGSRCAIRTTSPTSRRRRCRSTTPRRSSRRCRRRFPRIVGPKKDDICYATQNRQDAVKFMAPQVDVVIVVGSPNSSNSNRLREVAANRGIAGVHGRPRRSARRAVDRGQARASASPPARRHRRSWCGR